MTASLSVKQSHWLDIAVQLASMSTCHMRHGALIVRSGNVLSVGVNKLRNDPHFMSDNIDCISIHAEEQAIKACRGDTAGAVIYVARIAADGSRAMSRPCPRCQRAMAEAGISTAFYTFDYHSCSRLDLLDI